MKQTRLPLRRPLPILAQNHESMRLLSSPDPSHPGPLSCPSRPGAHLFVIQEADLVVALERVPHPRQAVVLREVPHGGEHLALPVDAVAQGKAATLAHLPGEGDGAREQAQRRSQPRCAHHGSH